MDYVSSSIYFLVQAKPTLRGIGNSGAYDDFESALQHEPESGALSHKVSTGGLQTSQLFATAKKTIQEKYREKKQVINGSHIDSDGDKEAIKKQSYCNRM